MNLLKKRSSGWNGIFLVVLFLLVLPVMGSGIGKQINDSTRLISKQDIRYLQNLAEDTWNCIDYLADKNTQLPYDNIQKGEYTSVTNIGLYVASLAAAVDMGFISRRKAVQRLETLLVNLEQFTKWNGFTQSWNSVINGHPAGHDPWISTLDSGNYYAGLMVGRAYFPKLKPLFDKIIEAADWSKFYNAKAEKLYFGYNCKEQRFGGNLDFLGSDARLAYFLAIAKNKIPARSWKKLNRNMEERYDMQYFQPGWQGGGLFMQMISGLILNEKDTFIGHAAANFAYAQIIHAQKNNYPVWGWSASAAPQGGYLGMNALQDKVVTPHASALAIHYYPARVVENLKKLEEMGARKPWVVNGKKKNFGFRDSINLKTKAVADNYLVLDQCMLFMALANFLDNGIIWETFKENAGIREGYRKIPDLQPTGFVKKISGRDSGDAYKGDSWGKIIEKGGVATPYIEKVVRHADAVHVQGTIKIDGELAEWQNVKPIMMGKESYLNIQNLKKLNDQDARVFFMWDKKFLYFAAEVMDNDLIFNQTGENIWKDDIIEFFIAPQQDDFVWGRKNCFQIGLAANGPEGRPQTWAWFQDGATGDNVLLAANTGKVLSDGKQGYIIEAAIKWSFLGIKPAPDMIIGVAPAIHFIDSSRENNYKLEWSFLPDGKSLGQLILKK